MKENCILKEYKIYGKNYEKRSFLVKYVNLI